MTDNRLADYVAHMRLAAADACAFVDGMSKPDFLADKRTQQAVTMSTAPPMQPPWIAAITGMRRVSSLVKVACIPVSRS